MSRVVGLIYLSIDVVKGFVTPQLSRFLRLRQLLLIIIGAHVTQV
jgi:hypothetical protein